MENTASLGVVFGEQQRRENFILREIEELKKQKADALERTSRLREEEAGLDARIARLQQEEARHAAQQQDIIRQEDKYPREALVETLLAEPRITGAEALGPITEPTTLEEALKLCEKAKDEAKAGVAYKFSVLAKQGKAYICDKIRELNMLDVPVTIDLLIETARKERSEGGIGHYHECRMVDFALYVDYVTKKYGFTWDNIPFKNWQIFDSETCTLLQGGKWDRNSRFKVGLQFLKNEGIEVRGNPKADIIDDPQYRTRLQEAMIEASARRAEGPAGAPL